MSDEWKTNEWGVSTLLKEPFDQWEWGESPEIARRAAECVMDEIETNAMAFIECNSRDAPEMNVMCFDGGLEINFSLTKAVEDWVAARTNFATNVVDDYEDISQALMILDELAKAATLVNRAIGVGGLAFLPPVFSP